MVENATIREKESATSQFADVLAPSLLKKVYAIKDASVQKAFYRTLATIARHLPGIIGHDPF